MTTIQFTQADFEAVLIDSKLQFESLGWMQGERCYHVTLDEHSGIRIRSSIRENGVAAAAGEDSIRLWLVANGKPLASKEITHGERWVTRVPGWEKRLIASIDRLRDFRKLLGNCKSCGMPNQALVSHSAKNPNRKFTKCVACGQWGAWLNEHMLDRQFALTEVSETTKKADVLEMVEAVAPITDEKQAENASEAQPEIQLAQAVTQPALTVASLAAVAESEPAQAVQTPAGSETAKIVKPRIFKPSTFQTAIKDFVLNDKRALRVEAYAGSGKTSTNAFVCRALPERSSKVKMMVFSKANQLDMQQKIPAWIPATTTHSAGFADIRRLFRSVRVDDRKTWEIIKELYPRDFDVRDMAPAIVKLVSLLKNTLQTPDNAALDELCERYDVQVNGSKDVIFDAVGRVWQVSLDRIGMVIDFDDMLFAPAFGVVSVDPCDLLFVDEYQDNNQAQETYYLKTRARVVFVGDAKQAIYGFRGAMIGAMDRMQTKLNAERLSLPISYRCAKSVIEYAQRWVPEIQAKEDAVEGIVETVESLEGVRAGDLVLCRNNAPLVKPCFELIRSGVKATIKGRDIGNNLLQLVKRVEKKMPSFSFMQLLANVQEYTDTESSKLDLQHRESQAASLRDQCETIMALSEGCNELDDLSKRVNTIFSDEVQGVSFSTIHKIKGGEADRVFVIKPELLSPMPYDTKPWQLEQLENLNYVAVTRAREELRFVTSTEKKKGWV